MLKNQILVGSEFLDKGSAGSMEHRDPATDLVNGEITLGGVREIHAAVEAAKAALPRWEAMGFIERRDCLLRLAAIIESWGDQFRALSLAENGMPEKGFAWRLQFALEWVRQYAGYADKVGGDVTMSSDDGELQYLRNEPYGVVGIIITWNSPLLSLAMKIPAALTAGNTVVVKPSELTPYTPLLFARACLEAGMPAGAVNIVPGGADAGEALVVHPEVEKISFTGGLSTAARIAQAGAAHAKPFCMELGGKSAHVVFPDANIPAVAAQAAGELSNAGQTCAFGSRIFVHEDARSQFTAAFLEACGSVVVGDPGDAATGMGPLISRGAQERVLSFVAEARDRQLGKLALGGGLPRLSGLFGNGYFVQPTVFEDVDPGSMLAQEEIFGPVYSVMTFRDEEEALRLVNNSRFGLVNGVHTKDLRRALRMAAKIKSGSVYINAAIRAHPWAPFGGFKASGYGKEGGRAGLDEFLRIKTIGLA